MINARSGTERRWQKMCLIYITQLGYIMSLPIFMLSKYEPHTKIYSEVHRVMFSDILLMPIIPTKKYIIIISISIPRRSLLQTPPLQPHPTQFQNNQYSNAIFTPFHTTSNSSKKRRKIIISATMK